MNDFFKGLKVVELANVLAGPAVGLFFSELGADVIKIENKLTGGDVTRTWKLPCENKKSKSSAYYASVNWNKKSRFLNLKNKAEKQQVYELIKTSDIVITNYKSGDDKKLGMEYSTFKKINPRIIHAQINGYGEKIKRTAYDIVLQAETGFMYMNGTPTSGPLKMPVAMIDLMAAHQLKEGILIALLKRAKSGKGSKVSVSLFDSAIASLANQASSFLMTSNNPQPLGSLHPNIAPYGEIFITKDNRQLVLAIGNDKQFDKFCKIMNMKSLLTEPKFQTNTDRVKNRKELQKLINPLIGKYNSKHIMRLLIQDDIPAGLINSMSDLSSYPKFSNYLNMSKGTNGETELSVKTVAFKISL